MKIPAAIAPLAVVLLLSVRAGCQILPAVDIRPWSNTPPNYPLFAVGYHLVGFGWTFTPTSDLRLTDLGRLMIGTPSPSDKVCLWDADGNLLASATNFASPTDNKWISYASVTPVLLHSGQSYLVDLSGAGDAVVAGAFDLTSASPGITEFTLASQLAGFSAGSLTAPGQLDSQSFTYGTIYLGPSFRFEPIPEPGMAALMTLGAVIAGSRRRQFLSPS